MGWHPCPKCKSKKWTLCWNGVCNVCDDKLFEKEEQHIKEFWENMKGKNVIAGMALSKNVATKYGKSCQ